MSRSVTLALCASTMFSLGCGSDDASSSRGSGGAGGTSASGGTAGNGGSATGGGSNGGSSGSPSGGSGGSAAGGSGGTASGPLFDACGALVPGASADFPSGAQEAFTEADLAWQTVFHHDDLHGLIHLMGKPANADTSWKHEFYAIETEVWTVVSDGMWNNSGHIYGNFAMDFTTGDLFQERSTAGSDEPRRLRWWQWSQSAWTVAPKNQDIFDGAMETHANGVGFHPDLYGPGDGGAIWTEQAAVHFWRKSTDAVESVSFDYGEYGEYGGASVYWAAQNAVFVGGASGADLLRITPNATAGATPVLTNVGTPPLRTAGESHEGGAGFGSLHVHPGDHSRLLLVETAGSRVYVTSDGESWSEQEDHPFARVPRVLGSLRGGNGCIWALGRDGSGSFSELWKPPLG